MSINISKDFSLYILKPIYRLCYGELLRNFDMHKGYCPFLLLGYRFNVDNL